MRKLFNSAHHDDENKDQRPGWFEPARGRETQLRHEIDCACQSGAKTEKRVRPTADGTAGVSEGDTAIRGERVLSSVLYATPDPTGIDRPGALDCRTAHSRRSVPQQAQASIRSNSLPSMTCTRCCSWNSIHDTRFGLVNGGPLPVFHSQPSGI